MLFHTSFTRPTAELASKVQSPVALRLLLLLPDVLSYTDWRRLDQVQTGARLNVTNSAISRAMKELHALGVVERKGKGPVTLWRLSSDYGWRGDVDSFHAHQRQRGKPAPAKPGAGPLIAAEGILWKVMTASE